MGIVEGKKCEPTTICLCILKLNSRTRYDDLLLLRAFYFCTAFLRIGDRINKTWEWDDAEQPRNAQYSLS